MAVILKNGFEFRKPRNGRARWHIALENSQPGQAPLCARSGIYCLKEKKVRSKKQVCPDCFEEAKKYNIL